MVKSGSRIFEVGRATSQPSQADRVLGIPDWAAIVEFPSKNSLDAHSKDALIAQKPKPNARIAKIAPSWLFSVRFAPAFCFQTGEMSPGHLVTLSVL